MPTGESMNYDSIICFLVDNHKMRENESSSDLYQVSWKYFFNIDS